MNTYRLVSTILAAAFTLALSAARPVTYAANDSSAVRYVGRTVTSNDSPDVTFNWSGTYIETVMDGRDLKLHLSDTGRTYFDVFVDGELYGKISSIAADTVVTVAEGLPRGQHTIKIAKRSEGETGVTTFHEFILPKGGTLAATQPRDLFIEFIGDSLSAGFGTEGKDRSEPFTPENENTNLSFSTIVPRYFDADYAVIAHSGRGVIRNYGDSIRQSVKGTMSMRYKHALDGDDAPLWDFSHYTPNLVVINLGANDFSTEPHPYRSEFIAGYTALLKQVMERHGSDIKILCIIPYAVTPDVDEYYRQAIADAGSDNIKLIRQPQDQINATTDRGAVWHPNHNGQRKTAMLLIPYIATMMDWPLPLKPIE